MDRIGKYLLLTLLLSLCEFKESRAQSLEILSDSIITAIRNSSMDAVMRHTPSYSDLKLIFDSVYKEKGDPFILMKEQRMKVVVRRQYSKLVKEAKSERIDVKKLRLDRIVKEEGSDSLGVSYALVKCRCESGNKRFTISYVALKCGANWRLADELRLEPAEE